MEIGPLRTARSPVPIEGTLATQARTLRVTYLVGLFRYRSACSDADHDLSPGAPALGVRVGVGDPLQGVGLFDTG
jgi:hypothetical protein